MQSIIIRQEKDTGIHLLGTGGGASAEVGGRLYRVYRKLLVKWLGCDILEVLSKRQRLLKNDILSTVEKD